MNLMDIHNFFNQTYTSSNPELLIKWLLTFKYCDQMLFMNLFVINRIRMVWKSYKHFNDDFRQQQLHEPNCRCELFFDTYLKELLSENVIVKHPWFFKRCIGKKIMSENETQKLNFSSALQMRSHLNVPVHFSRKQPSVHRRKKFVIDTSHYVKNDDDQGQLLTLKWLETFTTTNRVKLQQIINKINIKEFHVLANLDLPTVRTFDMLLPEYLRIESRRNRNRNVKNVDAETVLVNVYSFFNRENFHQIDTSMRMTTILPSMENINEMMADVEDKYYYQAKLSGIRLFIYKNKNRDFIVLNENHIPLNLNNSAFQRLKQDTNETASFAGEFLMMLYNFEVGEYAPKSELIKYLATSMNMKKYEIKFVLLDLYLWQSTNLLIDSYERRYKLFDEFILHVDEKGRLFVKVKNYYNSAQILNEYTNYLTSADVQSSVVTGVVYRNKRTVFQSSLKFYSFNDHYQKVMLVYKYRTVCKVLSLQSPTITVNGTCCVINIDSASHYVYCLCYQITDNCLYLALFDKNYFTHFCVVETDFSNNAYRSLLKQEKRVKINGVHYSWFIIRVGFSDNFKNVLSLKIYPEKTLIDCDQTFKLSCS